MASRGDILAGRAYVTLHVRDLAKFKRTLQNIGTNFQQAGQNMASVGSRMMTVFGGALASLTIPVKLAGDMMETTSKFRAVFGDQAKAAEAWGDSFSKAVGRARSDTMNGMAAFDAMFTGLGFGAEQAAEMSKEMQTLAVDFGSFHNVSDPEAIQRFVAALAGSAQVLDMYGISIRQGTLDLALLARGFPSVAKGATEAQKTLARMDIIRESMGRQGAIGDAIRTSASFSNQMRAMRAGLIDTGIAIGDALLPVITPLVSRVRAAAVAFAEWTKNNQGAIVSVAKLITAGFAAGVGLFALGKSLSSIGFAFSVLSWIPAMLIPIVSGIGALLTPLGLVVAGIALFAVNWGTVKDAAVSAIDSVKSYLGGLVDLAMTAGQGIKDAFLAGDFGLAGEIAMTTLRLAITRGFGDLIESMGPFWTDFLSDVIARVQEGDILGAFETLAAGVQVIFDKLYTYLSDRFGEFMDKVAAFGDKILGPEPTMTKSHAAAELISYKKGGYSEEGERKAKLFLQRTGLAFPAKMSTKEKLQLLAGLNRDQLAEEAIPKPTAETNEQVRAKDLADRVAARRRRLEAIPERSRTEATALETKLKTLTERAAGARLVKEGGPEGVTSAGSLAETPFFTKRGDSLGPEAGGIASGVSVSFSGAALMAMGRGSAQDRMAEDIKAHRKVGEKTKDATERVADATEELVASIGKGLSWA